MMCCDLHVYLCLLFLMFQADVGVEVEGGRGGVLAKSAVRIIFIDLGATPAARSLLHSLHFELLFIFA